MKLTVLLRNTVVGVISQATDSTQQTADISEFLAKYTQKYFNTGRATEGHDMSVKFVDLAYARIMLDLIKSGVELDVIRFVYNFLHFINVFLKFFTLSCHYQWRCYKPYWCFHTGNNQQDYWLKTRQTSSQFPKTTDNERLDICQKVFRMSQMKHITLQLLPGYYK